MNIAFPALIVFSLILPGSLLAFGYVKGSWNSPFTLGTVTNQIAYGVLLGPAIHLVGLWFVRRFLPYEVDIQSLLVYLTGWPPGSNDVALRTLGAISQYPGEVLSYGLATNLFGYGVGILLHVIVRQLRLDVAYSLLRFNNEWYYLFSGESLAFPNDTASASSRWWNVYARLRTTRMALVRKPSLVYVNVVTTQGPSTYLYSGLLVDYHFREGNLDKLILSRAKRRIIGSGDASSEASESAYYPVEADYFILKIDEIANLSIRYRNEIPHDENLQRLLDRVRNHPRVRAHLDSEKSDLEEKEAVRNRLDALAVDVKDDPKTAALLENADLSETKINQVADLIVDEVLGRQGPSD